MMKALTQLTTTLIGTGWKRLQADATVELAQLQAIATAAREQNDEFDLRCEQAIARLDRIANDWLAIKDVIEYNRIKGKIEGIKLAMSYHQDFVKRHPALAALEQETK